MSTFVHKSIADIPESSLIQELMSDIYWRVTLFNLKGGDGNPVPMTAVPLDGLGKGDVDILLVTPGNANTPTAIQVKRIKVSARGLQNQKPNGFRELQKGKRQANLLARIGFWQVYFWVFVVVDSRELNVDEVAAGRLSFIGMGQPLRSIVHGMLSPDGLDDRVGFMHWEFVHTMDDRALTAGTHGGHLVRLAKPLEQPERVTDWVREKFAAIPQESDSE